MTPRERRFTLSPGEAAGVAALDDLIDRGYFTLSAARQAGELPHNPGGERGHVHAGPCIEARAGEIDNPAAVTCPHCIERRDHPRPMTWAQRRRQGER